MREHLTGEKAQAETPGSGIGKLPTELKLNPVWLKEEYTKGQVGNVCQDQSLDGPE